MLTRRALGESTTLTLRRSPSWHDTAGCSRTATMGTRLTLAKQQLVLRLADDEGCCGGFFPWRPTHQDQQGGVLGVRAAVRLHIASTPFILDAARHAATSISLHRLPNFRVPPCS